MSQKVVGEIAEQDKVVDPYWSTRAQCIVELYKLSGTSSEFPENSSYTNKKVLMSVQNLVLGGCDWRKSVFTHFLFFVGLMYTLKI